MTHRLNEPSELLKKMQAHKGKCRHCGGIVKMYRDMITHKLLPNHCRCFQCGQLYHMNIKDIVRWEAEQWEQKTKCTT